MALFTTPGASLGGVPGSTALARLLVVISGESQGLQASLAQATSSLSSFQSNASQLGSTLIRGVTLPVLAIGGAAIKTAYDFQAAMARVQGLTQATASDMQGLSKQIIDISNSERVTASATELANSLYVTASAGLKDMSQALEVTTLAAEGASIGMGDSADISRVLIAALNEFGPTAGGVLTAAQAMDALVAAVKAGSAEPAELAISLGRLIPVAKQTGLSFQEVVAQVAALTNIGLPARVATTSLRALFTQFLAPTQKAQAQLKSLGISYDDLQNAVKAGPLVAFRLLNDAAEGQGTTLRNLIPQVRGLTAFLGLSGDKEKASAAALDQVTNSTGALDKALQAFIPTAQFKFANAMNKLQNAGIDVGNILLPTFNSLIGIVGSFGQAVQDLPEGMKRVMVAVLGVAAAAGPLLKIFGSLTTANGVFVGSLATAAKAFTVFAAGGILAVGALTSFAHGTTSVVGLLTGVVAGVFALSSAFGALRLAADAGKLGVNGLSIAIASLSGGEIAAIAAGIVLVTAAVALLIRRSGELGRNMKELTDDLGTAALQGETFDTFLKNLNVNPSVLQNLKDIVNQMGAMNSLVTPDLIKGLGAGASSKLLTTVKGFESGYSEAAGALSQYNKALEIAGSGQANLIDAFKSQGQSLDQFLNDVGDVNAMLNQGSIGVDEYKKQILQLALESDSARQAWEGYQETQSGLIQLHQLSGEAVDALAKKYGVSTDFISQKLSEVGISAVGLTGEQEKAWAEQVGLIDKSTGAIVGSLAEQQQAEAETVAKLQDSVAGAQDFFKGIDNITKASSSSIISAVEAQTTAMANFATNSKTLLARGLDPSALQYLAQQGPEYVAAFVKLSGDQLRQWQTNFAIAMGAGDAEVLNEGKHLQTKGNTMISGFAETILSNKHLTVAAMHEIMTAVQDAVGSGALAPKALPLISSFADGLSSAKGIPQKAVGGIVAAMVQKISQNPKFFNSGVKNVRAWAQGIAQNLNLPKGAVQRIVDQVLATESEVGTKSHQKGQDIVAKFSGGIAALKEKPQTEMQKIADGVKRNSTLDLFQHGFSAGRSFASGISASSGLVSGAVQKLIDEAKNTANNALKNSPRYFTYYMGQRVVDEFNKGLGDRQMAAPRRPFVLAGAGAGGPGGVGHGGVNVNLHVHGNVDDPRKMAREVSRKLAMAARDGNWFGD